MYPFKQSKRWTRKRVNLGDEDSAVEKSLLVKHRSYCRRNDLKTIYLCIFDLDTCDIYIYDLPNERGKSLSSIERREKQRAKERKRENEIDLIIIESNLFSIFERCFSNLYVELDNADISSSCSRDDLLSMNICLNQEIDLKYEDALHVASIPITKEFLSVSSRPLAMIGLNRRERKRRTRKALKR